MARSDDIDFLFNDPQHLDDDLDPIDPPPKATARQRRSTKMSYVVNHTLKIRKSLHHTKPEAVWHVMIDGKDISPKFRTRDEASQYCKNLFFNSEGEVVICAPRNDHRAR